jgi:hypothetical protein
MQNARLYVSLIKLKISIANITICRNMPAKKFCLNQQFRQKITFQRRKRKSGFIAEVLVTKIKKPCK